MPRRCTVCAHHDRGAIDLALVAGEPLRDIARRFPGVSKDAAGRHKAEHLPASMLAANTINETARGDTLLDKIRALEAEAREIGRRAHRAGDLKTALAAVRELTRIAELQARLVGDLADTPAVNVTIAADWVEIRSTVLGALAAHPEARLAVASALGGEVVRA